MPSRPVSISSMVAVVNGVVSTKLRIFFAFRRRNFRRPELMLPYGLLFPRLRTIKTNRLRCTPIIPNFRARQIPKIWGSQNSEFLQIKTSHTGCRQGK